MEKIIDNRGTGKTTKLVKEASENDGVIVCSYPPYVKELNDEIIVLTYGEYIQCLLKGTVINHPIYIDEIDGFLSHLDKNIKGYTISTEESHLIED